MQQAEQLLIQLKQQERELIYQQAQAEIIDEILVLVKRIRHVFNVSKKEYRVNNG